MPLNLRDKLRAVDGPRRPTAPVKAEPVFRDCWHDSRVLPLDAVPGAWELPMEIVRLMEPGTLPAQLAPEKILYLDTETTGLSGGAGTVAFLVGIGYLTPEGFLVHQYLMRDYPEERYLLENLRGLLTQFDVLCTFNGKSFDLPLLQSRLRMNRMDAACLDKPHIDLLHLARRIWKMRLGRCNLGHLEEIIFGEAREDDIPGSQVPERYFAYLKTGDFSQLTPVLDHNRQDIFSLCRLLTHMATMYAAPEQQRHEFAYVNACFCGKHVKLHAVAACKGVCNELFIGCQHGEQFLFLRCLRLVFGRFVPAQGFGQFCRRCNQLCAACAYQFVAAF